MGPKKIARQRRTFGDRSTFEEMLGEISDRFGQEFREITLEQAQAVIFGANCSRQRFAPEYAANSDYSLIGISRGRKPIWGNREENTRRSSSDVTGNRFSWPAPTITRRQLSPV
jgi:hypothetical protein